MSSNYEPSGIVLSKLERRNMVGTHHGRGSIECVDDARLVGRLAWWNRPYAKGERRDKEGPAQWEALIFQHGNETVVIVVWLERQKSGAVVTKWDVPGNFKQWFSDQYPDKWELAESLIVSESPLQDDAPSSQDFTAGEISSAG